MLSERSLKNLATAHPKFLQLFSAVAEITPCEVICGWRGEADQHTAFVDGKSKLDWPKSKHNNTLPDGTPISLAVDVVPLPVDWADINAFYELARVVKAIARLKGINITWGGSWTSFHDFPHYELKEV
jgi:peptidoglycan L-alanyl-D-glutamate endopeptidase CwlK